MDQYLRHSFVVCYRKLKNPYLIFYLHTIHLKIHIDVKSPLFCTKLFHHLYENQTSANTSNRFVIRLKFAASSIICVWTFLELFASTPNQISIFWANMPIFGVFSWEEICVLDYFSYVKYWPQLPSMEKTWFLQHYYSHHMSNYAPITQQLLVFDSLMPQDSFILEANTISNVLCLLSKLDSS